MEAKNLAAQVRAAEPRAGSVAIWWLYQAGFLLKSATGTVVVVDPYLSDVVAQTYNQPRAVPPPFSPADITADLILATHSHDDHLDPGSIVDLTRAASTRLIAPPMAVEKAVRCGVRQSQTVPVRRGDTFRKRDVLVRAVYARHQFEPEPTPDAVGFVVEIGDVQLYHSGDTEYDARILDDTPNMTVSLVSINGTTSNMSAYEAALLAWRQRAAVAIPMHYGLWRPADYGAGATLDPMLFVNTHNRLAVDLSGSQAVALRAGEMLEISAAGVF